MIKLSKKISVLLCLVLILSMTFGPTMTALAAPPDSETKSKSVEDNNDQGKEEGGSENGSTGVTTDGSTGVTTDGSTGVTTDGSTGVTTDGSTGDSISDGTNEELEKDKSNALFVSNKTSQPAQVTITVSDGKDGQVANAIVSLYLQKSKGSLEVHVQITNPHGRATFDFPDISDCYLHNYKVRAEGYEEFNFAASVGMPGGFPIGEDYKLKDAATYQSALTAAETKKYSVRFLNSDGTPLATHDAVEEGAALDAPDTPSYPTESVYQYNFTGWSTEAYTNVRENLDVVAEYAKETRAWKTKLFITTPKSNSVRTEAAGVQATAISEQREYAEFGGVVVKSPYMQEYIQMTEDSSNGLIPGIGQDEGISVESMMDMENISYVAPSGYTINGNIISTTVDGRLYTAEISEINWYTLKNVSASGQEGEEDWHVNGEVAWTEQTQYTIKYVLNPDYAADYELTGNSSTNSWEKNEKNTEFKTIRSYTGFEQNGTIKAFGVWVKNKTTGKADKAVAMTLMETVSGIQKVWNGTVDITFEKGTQVSVLKESNGSKDAYVDYSIGFGHTFFLNGSEVVIMVTPAEVDLEPYAASVIYRLKESEEVIASKEVTGRAGTMVAVSAASVLGKDLGKYYELVNPEDAEVSVRIKKIEGEEQNVTYVDLVEITANAAVYYFLDSNSFENEIPETGETYEVSAKSLDGEDGGEAAVRALVEASEGGYDKHRPSSYNITTVTYDAGDHVLNVVYTKGPSGNGTDTPSPSPNPTPNPNPTPSPNPNPNPAPSPNPGEQDEIDITDDETATGEATDGQDENDSNTGNNGDTGNNGNAGNNGNDGSNGNNRDNQDGGEELELEDDETAQGAVDLTDDEIAQGAADTLAQTGTLPAVVFYLLAAAFLLLAIYIKKSFACKKNTM